MRFSYVKKERINVIPETAGVYVFLNNKKMLYIGKAANLRDRVKNHFVGLHICWIAHSSDYTKARCNHYYTMV